MPIVACFGLCQNDNLFTYKYSFTFYVTRLTDQARRHLATMFRPIWLCLWILSALSSLFHSASHYRGGRLLHPERSFLPGGHSVGERDRAGNTHDGGQQTSEDVGDDYDDGDGDYEDEDETGGSKDEALLMGIVYQLRRRCQNRHCSTKTKSIAKRPGTSYTC
jgi:hypothetical protein